LPLVGRKLSYLYLPPVMIRVSAFLGSGHGTNSRVSHPLHSSAPKIDIACARASLFGESKFTVHNPSIYNDKIRLKSVDFVPINREKVFLQCQKIGEFINLN